MGNKQKRKISKRANLKRRREHAKHIIEKNRFNSPKSLRVLCERVVKKYKLLPEPKRFTPPETFSVVGGKPLRRRSEKLLLENTTKARRYTRNPKSLVKLCERVVAEYNLLPQTEETLQPTTEILLVQKNDESSLNRPASQSDVLEKRQRGRPRKKTNEETPFALRCEIKRPKGRPPKDPCAASYVVKYTYPQQPPNVRIKQEELDLPVDVDPLQDDDAEDYTIEIKEENFRDDVAESTDAATVPVPQVASHGIVINTLVPGPSGINALVPMQCPGPSGIQVPPARNFMTVVMDEYQIFANSIAEQLRALPPNRALLLQLDIQSMIDNEKQLMRDEN